MRDQIIRAAHAAHADAERAGNAACAAAIARAGRLAEAGRYGDALAAGLQAAAAAERGGHRSLAARIRHVLDQAKAHAGLLSLFF